MDYILVELKNKKGEVVESWPAVFGPIQLHQTEGSDFKFEVHWTMIDGAKKHVALRLTPGFYIKAFS